MQQAHEPIEIKVVGENRQPEANRISLASLGLFVYIASNIGQKITVQDIADRFSVSKYNVWDYMHDLFDFGYLVVPNSLAFPAKYGEDATFFVTNEQWEMEK